MKESLKKNDLVTLSITDLGSSGEGFLDPWYSNYVEMFHDEVVWISLKNTLIMMLVTLVGQVGIAIVLALMVDNITHGKHFYKTVYFFPIVISATALGLLFNLIFLYDKGMLNQILEKLGKVGLTDWKGEGIALFTMMLPVMWQYVGFYFVILITGLNNISDELYEAARIDGCTDFGIFMKIILPVIKPAMASWGAITLIARWNDFFWPLLYLRKQAKYTLMVTISLLPVSEGLSTPWPVILAGTTLVIIPIIILYLILERFQKAGMMEGAVKG